MVQQLYSHIYSKKTLIRVAFTMLSLGRGCAGACSVCPQGHGFNYTEGGGG